MSMNILRDNVSLWYVVPWICVLDSFLLTANLSWPKASNTSESNIVQTIRKSKYHSKVDRFLFSPELSLSTPRPHCGGKPLKSFGSSIDCCIKVLCSMATDPEGWNEHQTISALLASPTVSAFSPSLELSPIMLGHQSCPLHSQSFLQSLFWCCLCTSSLTLISKQNSVNKNNSACLCININPGSVSLIWHSFYAELLQM